MTEDEPKPQTKPRPRHDFATTGGAEELSPEEGYADQEPFRAAGKEQPLKRTMPVTGELFQPILERAPRSGRRRHRCRARASVSDGLRRGRRISPSTGCTPFSCRFRRLRLTRLFPAADRRAGWGDLNARRGRRSSARRCRQRRGGRTRSRARAPGRRRFLRRLGAAPGMGRRLLLAPCARRLHPQRRRRLDSQPAQQADGGRFRVGD